LIESSLSDVLLKYKEVKEFFLSTPKNHAPPLFSVGVFYFEMRTCTS